MKAEGIALLLEVALIHRCQLVTVHAQDIGAALLVHAHAQPQVALEVGDPAGDVLVVPKDQFPFACADVDPVHIMKPGIAIVEADQHQIGRVLRHRDNSRLNVLVGRQVKGRWRRRARRRRNGRVHGVDPEVLIAQLVLRVEDVLPVLAPEITDHGTGLVLSDWPGRAERLVDPLHPDVEDPVQLFDERHVAAVRRQRGVSDLWVAEEYLSLDQRRQPIEVIRLRQGRCGRQGRYGCCQTKRGAGQPAAN